MLYIEKAYADPSNPSLTVPNATEDPANFILYIVGVLVIPLVVSFIFNLSRKKHSADVGYLNNRSEYVTRSRFDREIESIQNLSRTLLVLIQATKDSETIDDSRWEKYHRRALNAIGDAAPFLNYLDLSNNSQPYCGVAKKNRIPSSEQCQSNSDSYSKEKSDKSPQKNCPCLSTDTCHLGSDITLQHIQEISVDSLYIDMPEFAQYRPKNLYQRACEILMFCRYFHENPNEMDICIRSHNDQPCHGSLGSPHLYRSYLDCRYERFIDCAYCRLNMIEYGRKSLRKKNKREQKEKGYGKYNIRKVFAANNSSYDQECPYIELADNSTSNKPK